MAKRLLESANRGEEDLPALQGYRILKELGRGGMGAVFLIRHAQSGAEAALKIMLPQVALEPRAQELFLRETENTKGLQHDNVVAFRDSGCSQGTFFFTMEYCDGGSVDNLMKRRGGTLPLDEAATIILQVLEGLTYAHQAEIPFVKQVDGSYGPGQGLIHRDLSPHNILLSGSGKSTTAKVSDFGLAKAFDLAGLSGLTRSGTAMGKPSFMAREQVSNFKYAGPDVDVWAAAACFYNMLTGAIPRDFPEGKDPWQVVLQTSAVPIRQRKPSIPKRLAEVIDLALVESLQITFRTAADFHRALESVL